MSDVDLEVRLRDLWELDGKRKELIAQLQGRGICTGLRLAVIHPEEAIPELEKMLDE